MFEHINEDPRTIKVKGKYEQGLSIEPHGGLDPKLLINRTQNDYSFEALTSKKAYIGILRFGEYLVSYIIGGLYTSTSYIPEVIKTRNMQNLTGFVVAESEMPTKVSISTGFNNFSNPFTETYTVNGVFSFKLTPGLYTAYTSHQYMSRAVRNFAIGDRNEEIVLITYSLDLNQAFTAVLTTNSSNNFNVRFELGPDSWCFVNVSYPRCGGTRLFYTQYGEILTTSIVSASQYLVYAEGESFQNDFISFYTKGIDMPHFTLEGKDEKGFWLLYCLNGRDGVKTLQVIDKVVEAVDLDLCTKYYGNQTWTGTELVQGTVQVRHLE